MNNRDVISITPETITELRSDQIFVFGSNEAGRHGAGAARYALENFGAEYGKGVGIQGQSYAVPTLDRELNKLPIEHVAIYIANMLWFADQNKHMQFLVTKLGCGLAGFSIEEIKSIFDVLYIPENVSLPIEFTK